MTSRRSILKAISLLPLAGGCTVAPRGAAGNFTPSGLPLRRVLVSEHRVIRTIAGLRPFRTTGFRVEAEPMNGKVVIHNYGHGGGGITLSWGTAHLAMELALKTPHKRCAVLGCGAVGLASARLMQDRGWQVTIYAKDLPPNTTSNVAGGQWSPTSVYDEEELTPAFVAQFEAAMRHAYRYYQNLVGPKYGVRWISNYSIQAEPAGIDDFTDRYRDVYPQRQELSPRQHPFPASFVTHFDTMLIEPAVYLPAMLQDFFNAGGRVEVREFASAAEVLTLPEPVLINCTGLGSKALFGDDKLLPIKGQLTFLLPQEEVDYIILGNDGLYMFPRADGILLGGTYERGQWSTEPDPEAARRILAGHRAFFNAMEDPWA